ncbi:hypothetical protein RhoFasK5_00316|nr:hypothetical protein [Rhodococcus kroppenstedtii]
MRIVVAHDPGGRRVVENAQTGGQVPTADHHPQRLPRRERAVVAPRGECGIVGQDRAGSHDDRIEPGAFGVHVRARGGTGDPPAGAVRCGDPPVEGRRELQRDVRSTGALPVQPGPQRTASDLVGEAPGLHGDACTGERLATAGRGGRRIGEGVDDARHTRGEQRLGARAGAAGVVAGLEGHHGRAAGRGGTGLAQGDHLRVRSARGRRGPGAHDAVFGVQDHRAYGRIRRADSARRLADGDGDPHRLVDDRRRQRNHQAVRWGDADAAAARRAATARPGSSVL